ncbi:bifunctional diaminohydroxyphosphoribosylaminopyrimidine deaminase/5-amino-6-(5-phosphoribosylamino)uracil reductase RibD [Streptosporangium sp. NPDC002721]|uniref:bifunctional diaminohydroxyphosphoribosylaminopyrimidine deaminase/5-amino-6-(5-phosphoribosylamino)uracil reductase RibD n=1 Tax=Streptosporangium sp. NPDC002721 TaxID=3366188 RepID=UPI003682CA86
MASPSEIRAMRRAIALSAHGLGTTSPNPPVGCVILDARGHPVGEGYHRRKGEAHAEGNALRAAGVAARGGTAVVTLEPCNHVGRAPACRQLLIEAGIARAVVALIDPTSRDEGGVTALRNAGVDVETGVLADEARLVLGPWLGALRLGRPVVTWAYVTDDTGTSGALERVSAAGQLRIGADAVLRVDGHLEEGVPDAHGAGVLRVPPHLPVLDPASTLRALYADGIRFLLLDVGPDLAGPFVAAGLVDHVVAYLPDEPSPSRVPMGGKSSVVPADFRIARIERVAGHVRVHATRFNTTVEHL